MVTRIESQLTSSPRAPAKAEESAPNLSIGLKMKIDFGARQAYVLCKIDGGKNSVIPEASRVKTKRTIFALTAIAAWIVLVSPTFAHHSTAEYDMASVTSIKGTVTKFEWTNPHAYIYIDAKDDKGATIGWTAELASLGMLARVNWKRDTVKPGDEITMFGNRAKDGRLVMRLEKIVFSSGQELSAVVR
jgi:hypothetical protein